MILTRLFAIHAAFVPGRRYHTPRLESGFCIGVTPDHPPTVSQPGLPSLLILAAILLLFTAPHAQAQKRIYIGVDDHTDYFWSADEDQYRQAFVETLDFYLDQADQSITAGDSAIHQGRFNTDGSLWLREYQNNKTPAQFNRLIDRIRSGHISVPMNPLAVSLGGTSAEAVLRGMYYVGQIERQHGLDFDLAYTMENQTQPLGLTSLWAGSGAKYSWKGVCGCDTHVHGLSNREDEIYWAEGLDGSRILMKWNSLSLNGEIPGLQDVNQGPGGYAEGRNVVGSIDYVDTNLAFQTRYSPDGNPQNTYQAIGVFGKGWDDFKTLTTEFVDAAKQETNAQRTVIVSNEHDFFEDFQATHGPALPSKAVSFGNEWEVYAAAMQEQTSRVKRSVEKLRAAEAMATVISLQNPDFMDGRETARDQAFYNMSLFFEHNMGMNFPQTGAAGKVKRIAWQKRLAGEVETYVDTLYEDGKTALGSMIPAQGADPRFFAFNPLGFTRTEAVDVRFDGAGPVHVVEVASGQEVPSQIVTIDGAQHLRVLASEIPSVGYRGFEIRSGSGDGFTDAATVTGSVIENNLVALTVAPTGAITSLIDKTQGNREFARSIAGKFINDFGGSTGTLSVDEIGPVSVTLLATSTGGTTGGIDHTTRITLYRDSDRIDIQNEITENFSTNETFAFSFNLDDPDVWHEEVGAVLNADLASNGGHYADQNARYDWLTLNHFADVSDGNVGITLSNTDVSFMKLGNSTDDTLDTTTPQILALAGGKVVNGTHGLPDQVDDTSFLQRFALQTHADFDSVNAMQFALAHQNPLVGGLITDGDALPEDVYQLLSIDDPNVLLWALKPAEEGIEDGFVARLWNLSDAATSFELGLTDLDLISALQTTHIETPIGIANLGDGVLMEMIGGQQMLTFLLRPVPEPSPLGLMLWVLIGCLSRRFRTRHSRRCG